MNAAYDVVASCAVFRVFGAARRKDVVMDTARVPGLAQRCLQVAAFNRLGWASIAGCGYGVRVGLHVSDPILSERLPPHLPLAWTALLWLAERHRLLPLLCWHLLALGPSTVHPAILAHLREQFDANTAQTLFLAGELHAVLQLLAAHGLPAVPLKGPALAATAYGNLALRAGNVDILVCQRDVPAALSALRSLLGLLSAAPVASISTVWPVCDALPPAAARGGSRDTPSEVSRWRSPGQ